MQREKGGGERRVLTKSNDTVICIIEVEIERKQSKEQSLKPLICFFELCQFPLYRQALIFKYCFSNL